MIQDHIREACKSAYNSLIEMGISKEQCRTILPLNLNTTMVWTGSLYALIRLCNQRLKPDAQKETREVVRHMLGEVYKTGKFKQSLKAFGYE